MSCVPTELTDGFGLGSSAGDFASGVAGQAAAELPGFGTGVLAGTLPEGLNALGSITPDLVTGSLSGLSDLTTGGSAGSESFAGGGTPLASSAGPGTPPTLTSTPALPGTAAASQGGPLGGAASSAAPASAPVSPTTAGTFGTAPDAGSLNLVGANATSPVSGTTLSGTPLSSMPSTDPTVGAAPAPAPTSPNAPNPKDMTSVDKFIDNPGWGTGFNVLKNNAGLALSALGMGASLMSGNKTLPGEAEISANARRLGEQSEQLQGYLNTGTLPPGMTAGLQSAGAAAKAAIRSRHAASGTSGSSSEMQELQSVDQQMVTQGANMALTLFQQGMQESQLSTELYKLILTNALQQDQALGNAIGRFAAAAGGGGQTFTLKAA